MLLLLLVLAVSEDPYGNIHRSLKRVKKTSLFVNTAVILGILLVIGVLSFIYFYRAVKYVEMTEKSQNVIMESILRTQTI